MDEPLGNEDTTELSSATEVTTAFMEGDRLQEERGSGVSVSSLPGEESKREGGGEKREVEGGEGVGERGETERVQGREGGRDEEEERGEDKSVESFTGEETREKERMPAAVVQEEIGEASITFEQVH